MNRIKFSIAIPSYKKKYLYEAIESVLAQTYTCYEIIIVDDCSPENLEPVVNKYNDARIHYYKNTQNCGAIDVVDNWNICLRYCTGDYVICMGDDDRLLPCCLEEYSKLIKRYPRIGVVHGWSEIIDENGDFYSMQQPRPLYEGAMSLLWNRWHGRDRQYIGDFCFNIKLLRQNGGFYKLPMAWGSDDITAVKAAIPFGIANTQVLCFQYRENRNSISSSGSQDIKMKATLAEKEWYKQFLSESLNIKDDIERRYHILLVKELNQHFLEKFKVQVYRDLKQNIWRVFHWIRVRKKYGISIIRILFAAKMVIESNFHGK